MPLPPQAAAATESHQQEHEQQHGDATRTRTASVAAAAGEYRRRCLNEAGAQATPAGRTVAVGDVHGLRAEEDLEPGEVPGRAARHDPSASATLKRGAAAFPRITPRSQRACRSRSAASPDGRLRQSTEVDEPWRD